MYGILATSVNRLDYQNKQSSKDSFKLNEKINCFIVDFFTDGIFKKALNFIQAREDPVDFLDLFMQYEGDKESFGGE